MFPKAIWLVAQGIGWMFIQFLAAIIVGFEVIDPKFGRSSPIVMGIMVLIFLFCGTIHAETYHKFCKLLTVIFVIALCGNANAAGRSANFIVRAAPEYEQTLASAAERFRKELAVNWLGHELPNWREPCPVSARIETGMGNGGVTSFSFDRGQAFGFNMEIQGDQRYIVESTLKHEVLHTVFATHFGHALPRWADEGACSTVEGRRETGNSHLRLVQALKTGRGIAFDQLFAMREYPADVMPLYDQGRSVTSFLIEHGGRRHFVDFLAVGLRDQDWPGAVAEMYGYRDLGELQTCWLDWLRHGSQLAPKEVRLRAPDT